MQEIKRMACRWWIALHCVLVTMASHAVEPRMDEAQAEVFVKMALAGIDREYPASGVLWSFRLAFLGAWALDAGALLATATQGPLGR